MTKIDGKRQGRKVLRPKSQILRRIGDELISSETVAVIEMVKNAYDADATRVLVRFHEPLEIDQGVIEIIDNGHGMSLQTIQSAWMEPATLYRKQQRRSERRGRRVLGEKGIGRFAASRLANFLEVVTCRANADHEVRVMFDWSQFDDQEKYLDQVEVLWEEGATTEICPGGAIGALWEADEKPEIADLTHGTILRMKRLRTKWEKGQFEDLRTGLARLISPFFNEESAKTDTFQIYLQLPASFEGLSGIVEPPEILMSPHYTLSGSVDTDGGYNLTLKLKGRDRHQPIEGQYGHPPRCGPFRIELRVWDRDQPSMRELAQGNSSTAGAVRQDLDYAAGISIYRDGFRVLPYGDPRNDWLRLDFRRVQNPTLRLSNNQVVGYILISADGNPGLRDQSNREGLMDGSALDDLRELVKMLLAELETRRFEVRREQEKTEIKSKGLFTDFNLDTVRDLVKQRYPADTELLTLVAEKENDLERRVKGAQEVLARYRRLATLGQLIDIVLHDGRTPLSKIVNDTHLGLRDIERAGRENDRLIPQLSKRFSGIKTQADVLATLFRKIAPFGGRKRGRPGKVRLEKVITDGFAVLEAEIAQVGAQVKLPDTNTQTTVDPAEIQEVIINLLHNSLYWLRLVPKIRRQITVEVQPKGEEIIEILFSDGGPGVEPEFRDRIFDPYFSTKPDGIGLGLTIAGEIINEYYDGELLLLDGGPLPGATFRITLRKRVG